MKERHMLLSKDEIEEVLIERHTLPIHRKLRNAGAAIAGLGGLGSHVAVMLARTGIGSLHLIDFDRVEPSNLNRQIYRMKHLGRYKTEALKEEISEINPYISVRTDTVKVTENNLDRLFRDDKIICEAFDRAENKAMLVNRVLETMPEKFLVAASGMAGISSANSVRTRRITSRFYLCGDESSDTGSGLGLVSSRVMCCAAHEAHMVLRILAEQTEP